MKSIVQEASSISKAIQMAWERAQQPDDFSVRIHEHPQKNFFGFTTKPAKIALFYQDSSAHKDRFSKKSKPRSRNEPEQSRTTSTKKVEPRPKRAEGSQPWSPEMATFAQQWMTGLLKTVKLSDKKFTVDPQRYHLKITFNGPVFEEHEKSRTFFRSCSHLMLQATRNKFKRPLKGFKVILTTNES